MDKDDREDDYGEIEVDLPENLIDKLDRLKSEEYIENKGEFVANNLRNAFNVGSEDRVFKIDPTAPERFNELHIIEDEVVEEELIRESDPYQLFADTTYQLQRFSRLTVDMDHEIRHKLEDMDLNEDEIEGHLYGPFIGSQMVMAAEVIYRFDGEMYSNEGLLEDFEENIVEFVEEAAGFAERQGCEELREETDSYAEKYFDKDGKLREELDI